MCPVQFFPSKQSFFSVATKWPVYSPLTKYFPASMSSSGGRAAIVRSSPVELVQLFAENVSQ